MQRTGSVRNMHQVNRMAGAHGLTCSACGSRLLHSDLRRLILACRKSFHTSFDVGLSVDAKRFGGKHYLAGCIYSGQSGEASVTNPVVLVCM